MLSFRTVNALSTLIRENPRMDLNSQWEKRLGHRISAEMTQGSSDV